MMAQGLEPVGALQLYLDVFAFSPYIVAIIDALYMYVCLRVTAVRKELRKFLIKACEE
jgi:hypothetical protein